MKKLSTRLSTLSEDAHGNVFDAEFLPSYTLLINDAAPPSGRFTDPLAGPQHESVQRWSRAALAKEPTLLMSMAVSAEEPLVGEVLLLLLLLPMLHLKALQNCTKNVKNYKPCSVQFSSVTSISKSQ